MGKAMTIFLSCTASFVLIVSVLMGWYAYFGPFRDLTVVRIRSAYRNRPAGEIVFYGASNFTYWIKMELDLAPFSVQNHGFGGSTDNDLMHCANRLLYPYDPAAVVFQSGSNDFTLGMTVQQVCENKDRMYAMFREKLPDAVFVVLSMLPLPGRAEVWQESRQVNGYLRQYGEKHDRMLFVDATQAMLTQNGDFRPEYFRADGIHLNRDGQQVWAELIRTSLETAVKIRNT